MRLNCKELNLAPHMEGIGTLDMEAEIFYGTL
jgi:hypothetical protein